MRTPTQTHTHTYTHARMSTGDSGAAAAVLASERLARHAARLVPADATLLVDISNVSNQQLDDAYERGHVPVLLSTHKSFDYRSRVRALPRVAPGTHWIVLLVPHEKRSGDDGNARRPVFDTARQVFVSSRARGSPRLRYHKHSNKCSVVDVRGREVGGRVHASCEIDDRTQLHVARALGLPLLTNDRALGRDVSASAAAVVPPPPPPPPMQLLMRHTRVVALVRDAAGRWAPRRSEARRRRRSRSRSPRRR